MIRRLLSTGDLNASEITMADEERIEIMLLVKEGSITMHDAVERVGSILYYTLVSFSELKR